MKICVTGVCGSGKTTVMKLLQEMGCNILIMDEYIHKIYQHNEIGYILIKNNFGPDYVNKTQVDRKKLGSLVFNNHQALAKLNRLMFGLMKKAVIDLDPRKTWFIEFAIYLNYEKEFKNLFDKIILINGSKKVQKKSLNQKFNYLKKFSTSPVEKIENPIKSNLIKVDYYVDNSKNIKYLSQQLRKIIEII